MENEGTAAATIDRIDTRATEPDLSAWLTKPEAAKAIGASEKQIERLAKKGQIEQKFRTAPGQARVSIFHPGDVERIVNAQKTTFRVQDSALATISDSIDARSTETFSGLAAALARLAGVAEDVSRNALQTIYVPMGEAVRLTGLPANTIRRLAREGRVARLSRKYRRADLEKL
jgi:DNA-binding transcriptional MerR regulator